MKLVSIVVPCYNEEESLPLFYEEIQKIMNQMKDEHSELTFELVFIDDGSRDKTLTLLREMALKDMRVRYISFSRNFGKEAGMFAGLENAKGDYVVVMDADLQHPPAFLPKMYNFVKDGEYDCATTRRVSRKGESKIRSAFARLFYKIMNKISQTEIVDGAQDFRFMSRQMVDAILEMHEYNRFSKGIFSWVGFKTRYIEYENVERVAGSTSWSFWGLFRYSLEGIMAFSTAPLMIACILGIIACLIGFVLLIIWIVQAVQGDVMKAQTGLMCALFLLGGLQMLCTGISAQYLAKAYMESKHRPIYLMRENEEIYRSRNQDKIQEN